MKKLILLAGILTGIFTQGKAQIFDIDTLNYNGDADRYINIIIMGDGYTDTEQTKFVNDAQNFSNYLFNDLPWSNYRNYFNIFAIKVISEESGTTHPNTATDCAGTGVPVSSPQTFFACSFDLAGIHRLIYPTNTSAIMDVLADNFPLYDQIIIIANTPYYGGAGGQFACSTAHTSSNEIINHELGHSFGGLADEYWAGDGFANERPNMTQETDPNSVKWKNWMGTNNIGINAYCCGGSSASWFKPHNNCKMQFLGPAFCSVCQQTIVERIHELTDAIVEYSPSTIDVETPDQYIDFKLDKLMLPVPNTLKITWTLDANLIASNTDSVRIDQNTLPNGAYYLTAKVEDTTELVRVDAHADFHYSMVTWTIHKNSTGVQLSGNNRKVSLSLYPNPSSEILNISLISEKSEHVTFKLMSMEGKVLRQYNGGTFVNDKYAQALNIQTLPPATYLLSINIDGTEFTERFIKK